MPAYKKIALTTGDKDGIGFEVAAKALLEIPNSNKKNGVVFFFFRHRTQEKTQPRYFKLLDKKWLRLTFNDLDSALKFIGSSKKSLPDNALIDLSLESSEAEWVLSAAEACRQKQLTSLVTGPLSKKIAAKLPNKPIGHTGIFRNMFPKQKFFMSFIGSDFNVVLVTDHIALNKVEKALNKETLSEVFKAAARLRQLLKSKKKIALLGLNPHAGENGLIGDTEKKLFSKLPDNIVGPLVPDAAFLRKNLGLYSMFICLYHDQGLIPFKMHHGQEAGVHLTLGLPFVRTSVDHGTAFDLFNKNSADPGSMLEAIRLNLKLIGA